MRVFGYWKEQTLAWRRPARALNAIVLFVCLASKALAQVETYEAQLDIYPDQIGWRRLPDGPRQGELTIQDGWFTQTMRLPVEWPEPYGEANSYRMDLDHFFGVDAFFVEWRANTDNPAWLIDPLQVVTVVSASGNGPLYHTVMTDSAVALSRLYVPRIVVPVSAEEPHVYRVEVFADVYIWYIDGVVVDSGIPEGPYPDANAFLVWGARRAYVDATTSWDYLRVGRIPDAGTGDFDSGGYAGFWDLVPVLDCFAKEGPGIYSGPGEYAGPGCVFMDFDFDADVDLRDYAAFQSAYEGE